MTRAAAMIDYGTDFRGPVAAASAALFDKLANKDPSLRRDPAHAGVSLCLPAEGDGEAARRRYKVVIILRLILGFAGIGLSLAVLRLTDKTSGPLRGYVTQNQALAIATACSLGGIFILISSGAAQRRFVMRRVGPRLGREFAGTRLPVFEIEDTTTFPTKMKAVTEDMGVLLLHPQRRCVIVEGLTHRYIIHAADVIQMRDIFGPNSVGLGILYRAAGVPLDITLRRISALVELKRKLTGSGKDWVTDRIARTFRGEAA
jgi:hypothetical protein